MSIIKEKLKELTISDDIEGVQEKLNNLEEWPKGSERIRAFLLSVVSYHQAFLKRLEITRIGELNTFARMRMRANLIRAIEMLPESFLDRDSDKAEFSDIEQALYGAGYPAFIKGDGELVELDAPAFRLTVTPGTAPPEVVADLLAEISLLYRKAGGNGINFTPEDISITENETAL